MKKGVWEIILKRPSKIHLVSCGVNEPHGRMTQVLGDFCVVLLGIPPAHRHRGLRSLASFSDVDALLYKSVQDMWDGESGIFQGQPWGFAGWMP